MRQLTSFRPVAVTALVASAAVLAACGSMNNMGTMSTFSQTSLPPSIQVPAGNKVAWETVGVGDITYECRDKANAPGQTEWVFVGPNAVLNDRMGKQVGKYYGPPATWEANDGSKLTATQLAVAPSGPTSLPFQLVKANPAMGSGAMTGVTHIQRVATKGGVVRPTPDQWKPSGRPEHLRLACTESLRRLRVERIDLYQLHCVDPEVPLEDSMGTLFDLQREGKIRHVGVSNFDLPQLERAMKLGTIVSVQNRYGVLRRQDEAMVRFCEQRRIAYLPWGPLSEGRSAEHPVLARVAARNGSTAAQVALAWLLAHSPVMIPIPGTSSLAHLEENLAARELVLTTDDMRELDAI